MSDRESRSEKSVPADADESFLERWSRRKQAAQRGREEAAAEEAAPDAIARDSETSVDPSEAPDPPAGREKQVADEASDPEPPGDEDMPPLESIDKGGSVAAFFSPNVSAGLRRAALRRLFSQPGFGAVDMLDDYAKDYTNRAPLGNIVTADMRYRAEQAAKRLARKLGESVEAGKGDEERVALGEDPTETEMDARRTDGPDAMGSEGAKSETSVAAERSAADTRDDDDNDDDQRSA